MVNTASYTKETIMEWLSSVKDPEIPVVSIEEMGMLKDVVLSEEGCEVIITPTYTGCPAMKMITEDVIALLQQKQVHNPSVKMVYTPAWTTDDMSETTKEKLRAYGIAPPETKSCSDWRVKEKPVTCPKCGSKNTKLVSQFGSTACKALHTCNDCKEPFDYFKCH